MTDGIDELIESLKLPDKVVSTPRIFTSLAIREKIHYKRLHPEYGWADFTFCVQRGKQGDIERVFVSRRQQTELPNDYVLDVSEDSRKRHSNSLVENDNRLHTLYISARGALDVGLTDMTWCEFHNCVSFRIHAPRGIEEGTISFDFSIGMLWVQVEAVG